MSKTKNGGLDKYGARPFEQQQFGTAGIEGVKHHHLTAVRYMHAVHISISIIFSWQ